MNSNFLLTYSYENEEGMSDTDYQWYESEERMLEDIQSLKSFLKDFSVNDAMEILQVREIKIE